MAKTEKTAGKTAKKGVAKKVIVKMAAEEKPEQEEQKAPEAEQAQNMVPEWCPIVMDKSAWMGSPFKIAADYGAIIIGMMSYVVICKDGKFLNEVKEEAQKEGRENAVEENEPADLVMVAFAEAYVKLGRERFLSIIEENQNKTKEWILEAMEAECKNE